MGLVLSYSFQNNLLNLLLFRYVDFVDGSIMGDGTFADVAGTPFGDVSQASVY